MLDLALSNLSSAERNATARHLHLSSRTHRSLTLSALPHLSLERFDKKQYPTCEVVYRGSKDGECFDRAVVPDPPIPWRTLAALAAAGGALESLDIRQCQAEPLLAGAARAATAPVLAATLAGLRCLRVTELAQEEDAAIHDHWPGEAPFNVPLRSHKPVQLQCVGRLISSCSGLTKLVLATHRPHGNMDASFLEGAWTAAATEEEEAAEAEEQGQGQEDEGTHGTQQGVMRLPQLCHLEVEGKIGDFLPTFVGAGGAGSLTSCRMTHQEGLHEMEGVELMSLAACTKLQELLLDRCDVVALGAGSTVPPEHLLRSSAFTKLVLDNCYMAEDVLPAVCVATQLRHLDLRNNQRLVELPAELSSLQQLTFLDISGTGVEELPQQLGKWMPQLQVLGVENTKVTTIPKGLKRCVRKG
jgi:hypothetical protein